MRAWILLIVLVTATCKKNNTSHCLSDQVQTTYSGVDGCGSLHALVYLDKYKLVSIQLDEAKLGLSTSCRSYKIEDYPTDIKVNYHTYANHPDSIYFAYCTDVMPRFGKYGMKTTWNAVSGNVTAVVSKLKSNREQCEDYQASVSLENVKLTNGNRDTLISSLLIKDRLINAFIP